MSTHPNGAPRPLPERPHLRHLKDQAKDLLKSGQVESLTDAQFQIARLYGFPSWPKLKAHVDSVKEIAQLKRAIDTEDLQRIKILMTRNPALHAAPLSYAKDGPLTWVAECRVPWQPPSPTRLAIAKWMIENGSDVHQGGDGPLMRAALNGDRIPMMELLASYGANVNALWHGHYPIIFAPCETLDPAALQWLLDRGADPNCMHPGPALDHTIGSYVRAPEALSRCISLLLEAGGATKYNLPPVLAILCDELDVLAQQLAADPALVTRQFSELDCGATGGRTLTLKGATLLHVAAEYGNLEAVKLLLHHGADVNARGAVDAAGVGGQTAIFHAATQFRDAGFSIVELLLENGADLSIRARLPGHYEKPAETIECTPLEYASLFPGGQNKVVMRLL